MMSKRVLMCLMLVSILLAGTARSEMIAHWTLDKADYGAADPNVSTDPNYYDVSGSGNNAIAGGTPVFVPDVLGNPDSALSLDGSNGYAQAGTLNPKAANNEMTLNMWINYSDGQGGVVLAKRDGWDSNLMMWQLSVGSGDIGFVRAPFNFGTVSRTTLGVTFDQWHMLSITHDELNNTKFYVDGALKTEFNFSFAEGVESSFNIGMCDFANEVPNESYVGLLDDVSIYDSVLTAAEITSIYRNIIQAPAIVANPLDNAVELGGVGDLSFVFSSVGLDQQTVWYKQVGELDAVPGTGDDIALSTAVDPDVTITLSAAANVDEYVSVLSVAGIAEEDDAYYYCVASDSGGSVTSVPAAIYIRKVLAHWTLDQADYSASTFADTSGNGNNAIAASAPTFVADVNGNANTAIAISQANPCCAAAGPLNPSKNGKMTVSAWINYDGLSIDGKAGTIFSKRDSWSDTTMMWQININTSAISIQRSPFVTISIPWADTGLTLNEWHLFTMTHDSADNSLLTYIDGELVNTSNFAMGSGTESAFNIGMGGYEAGLPNEVFSGMMDDAIVYNYVLDSKAVLDLYNATSPVDKVLCLEPYAAVIDVAGPGSVVGDVASYTAQPDCKVDMYDFMVFAQGWLTSGSYPN